MSWTLRASERLKSAAHVGVEPVLRPCTSQARFLPWWLTIVPEASTLGALIKIGGEPTQTAGEAQHGDLRHELMTETQVR